MIGLKSFLNFIFLSKRWGTLYLLYFAWAKIYQEFHKVQSVLKSNLGKELEINFPSFPIWLSLNTSGMTKAEILPQPLIRDRYAKIWCPWPTPFFKHWTIFRQVCYESPDFWSSSIGIKVAITLGQRIKLIENLNHYLNMSGKYNYLKKLWRWPQVNKFMVLSLFFYLHLIWSN